MIKKLEKTLLLAIITTSVYNCGYKGPLYLPKSSASSPVKTTASDTDSSKDKSIASSTKISSSASKIAESISITTSEMKVSESKF